jgi:hypothetical protein
VIAPAAALSMTFGAAGGAHAQPPRLEPATRSVGKSILIQTSADLALPAHP